MNEETLNEDSYDDSFDSESELKSRETNKYQSNVSNKNHNNHEKRSKYSSPEDQRELKLRRPRSVSPNHRQLKSEKSFSPYDDYKNRKLSLEKNSDFSSLDSLNVLNDLKTIKLMFIMKIEIMITIIQQEKEHAKLHLHRQNFRI